MQRLIWAMIMRIAMLRFLRFSIAGMTLGMFVAGMAWSAQEGKPGCDASVRLCEKSAVAEELDFKSGASAIVLLAGLVLLIHERSRSRRAQRSVSNSNNLSTTSADIERFRELGKLIQAAQAELSARQTDLVYAFDRGYNPTELGVQIAHLGRQIAEWQREEESLFRRMVGKDKTESVSFPDGCYVPDRRMMCRRSAERRLRQAT